MRQKATAESALKRSSSSFLDLASKTVTLDANTTISIQLIITLSFPETPCHHVEQQPSEQQKVLLLVLVVLVLVVLVLVQPCSNKQTNATTATSKDPPGTADLVPFVAAVLGDRSLHGLMEEHEKVKDQCEKLLLLQVKIYEVGVLSLESQISAREGCVVKDHGLLRFCIGGFPFHKVDDWEGVFLDENAHLEIRLGGVIVFKSNLVEYEDLGHNFVKKIIWDLRIQPVAILFDIERIPGIMEALGPEVLQPSNVRELKSLLGCMMLLQKKDIPVLLRLIGLEMHTISIQMGSV